MLEHLLGIATEVTKFALAVSGPNCNQGTQLATTELPTGWSGSTTASEPWLDLRGPNGSRLFVTAETEEVVRQSRRAQESFMGISFSSLTLAGRTGFGGGSQVGELFIKWCALPTHNPRSYVTVLYQSRFSRERAELEFETLMNCVRIVELLPGITKH